jgi:hypothetical protein
MASAVMIRREGPEDVAGERRVNERAFGRPAEADLVDALRAAGTRTAPGGGSRRHAGADNRSADVSNH